MAPVIRLLTPADAPAFVELRRLALRESPWAFGSSPETDRASDPEVVASRLAGADQAAAGAVEGDAMLAIAVLRREEGPKRAHIAGLFSVYTHPGSRGRGLGRGVCGLLIETARQWPGVTTVQLSVSDRAGAALAMYQSLGFAAWGVEPDALRVDGESIAERHMALRL